ncbi:MAG: hypothetical protein JNL29_09890 [Nitrospira sp.]|nr:hypothetical protein [Nitrospira sp.]
MRSVTSDVSLPTHGDVLSFGTSLADNLLQDIPVLGEMSKSALFGNRYIGAQELDLARGT